MIYDSNKIKIHLPKIEDSLFLGELKNIIYKGLKRNPRVELSKDENNCDYIFLDFRHIENGYVISKPNKTIIIDYRDTKDIFNINCLSYFKRSVDLRDLEKVNTISYCVKDEISDNSHKFNFNKDIDISIFFSLDIIENSYMHNRTLVTNFIKKEFKENKIHVGVVGKNGRIGRNSIQNEYYDMMRRSKIIVTCNPDRWEGDYRLYEACSSKALVFCDEMKTPYMNNFKDGEHIIYYSLDDLESLKDKINYYLENENELNMIASRCLKFTIDYHKPTDKINEILNKIQYNDRKNKTNR